MGILTRRLALWGGAVALAAGGFAFMASNAFTGGRPGAGTGTITVSGYTISNVNYQACGSTTAANPEFLCWAHLTVAPKTAAENTAGTVWVQFNLSPSGHTTWYKCTAEGYSSPYHRYFTCTLRNHKLNPLTVIGETVAAVDGSPPPTLTQTP
jgi:hypothetical protein